MIDMHQAKYNSIFRVEGAQNGDLDDEVIATFKINMVNCIMNIVKLLHPKNEYLYIPDDHDCDVMTR